MNKNKIMDELYEIKDKIDFLIKNMEEDNDTVYDTDSETDIDAFEETLENLNNMNNELDIKISPNLYHILNQDEKKKQQKIVNDDDSYSEWTPPSHPGLNNSKSIL